MKIGELIRYAGASDAQVKWRANDDPRGVLVMGAMYRVKDLNVRPYHTDVQLEGFEEYNFNSVCFEDDHDKAIS